MSSSGKGWKLPFTSATASCAPATLSCDRSRGTEGGGGYVAPFRGAEVSAVVSIGGHIDEVTQDGVHRSQAPRRAS